MFRGVIIEKPNHLKSSQQENDDNNGEKYTHIFQNVTLDFASMDPTSHFSQLHRQKRAFLCWRGRLCLRRTIHSPLKTFASSPGFNLILFPSRSIRKGIRGRGRGVPLLVFLLLICSIYRLDGNGRSRATLTKVLLRVTCTETSASIRVFCFLNNHCVLLVIAEEKFPLTVWRMHCVFQVAGKL